MEVERGAGGKLAAAITTHPREFVAIVMATAATVVIFVNALFLQHGPHPAPIFATRPLMRSVTCRCAGTVAAPGAVTEGHGQLVADIQQALSQKGFYDGAIDGLWGAKTDSAVRDFLQAAGLNASAEASESLLRTIKASPVRAGQAAAPAANDPIARLLAPPSAPAGTRPSASWRSSARSPISATGRSSRRASPTPRHGWRSRNSSASTACRSPARCPTAWCASSAP